MARPNTDLAYFHTERDPEEQASLALPDGERAIYHCLWLTEFYTPAETDAVISRLNRMSGVDELGDDPGLAEWMRDRRGRPFSAAWRNVGYFIPRGGTRAFIGPTTFETDFPRGVTHAPASLVSLTPSLTALVLQFVFDDSVTEEWLAPLNQSHSTFTERRRDVKVYVTPTHQAMREVLATRRAIRTRTASWLSENLPGYFSRVGEPHPSIEVVSFKLGTPLLGRGRLDDYLYVLGLYEDVGDCIFDDDLRFRWRDDKNLNASILAASEPELYRWFSRYELGHEWSRLGVEVRMNDLSQFAATVALDGLIASFERSLASTRDRAIASPTVRSVDAQNTLETQLAGVSRAVQAIGPELMDSLEHPWFARDLERLRWLMDFRKDDPSPAAAAVDSYKRRASSLAASERIARDLLVAGAQVSASREGLRLQRTSRLIALAALAVAFGSFATAVLANFDKLISGLKALGLAQ
jgi:hypothetical protein